MIPKIIHFCWFGSNEKPENVENYIKSWKNKLPDYEIIEWNENNFDINICDYTREAYKAKKYAFVSDYARLYALNKYGGIYLDTDVEIVKSFSPLLDKADIIFGFEEFERVATSTIISRKDSLLLRRLIEQYHKRKFFLDDGEDHTTNVETITKYLVANGLNENGLYQELYVENEKLVILNKESFSPINYSNLKDNRSRDTYAIHHFEQSWSTNFGSLKKKAKNIIISLIGVKFYEKVRKLI
ncbi:glycosyltransferase family 32 protein [Vibrio breoganii]